MKKQDIFFIAAAILIFAPFFLFDSCYYFYKDSTTNHPYVMAFIKFFILATAGEMIGLRIKEKCYNYKGFGLLPRAVVWGFLGIWIAVAMKVFSMGIPPFLEALGITGVTNAMSGEFTLLKFVGAFGISFMMNTSFAPVFMTIHKITDTHIIDNGGNLSCFIKPLKFGENISRINWKVQWNFVFKKTIPLFWIPAHTITFLLPANIQVLFAASLSIVLGVFLSLAAIKSKSK